MVEFDPRKFLDPKTVAGISDFRLLTKLIVDGFLMGQHRGPHQAISLEYSKHRDYHPGDPLKLIDWKLFARTDRYFVKQFEEETNLKAWLLIDNSRSMSYQGKQTGVSKLHYSVYLAAAITYLLLSQKDMVGAMLFDSRIRKLIPPSSAARQLNILLSEFSKLKGGETSDFVKSAAQVASRIKTRGLLILFTDFLIRPEHVEKTLKRFLIHGNELILFHVLSFEELRFPFRRFGYFQDMETKDRVLLRPDLYKDEYLKQIKIYLETVKDYCRKLKISYLMLETTTPFDKALNLFLKSRMSLH